MASPDPKEVLWANVLALMRKHYGGENLTRLARETKCGPGTASRIKARVTSVGLDTLEKIADRFDVQPWQLLVPEFNPDRLPSLKPISDEEQALLSRLLEEARRIASSRN